MIVALFPSQLITVKFDKNWNKYFIDDSGFISKPMLLFNETHYIVSYLI